MVAKERHFSKIEYCIIAASLGKVLIAATSKGFCFIAVGDSEKKLLLELTKEFPDCSLTQTLDPNDIKIRKLIDYIEGKKKWPELPFDVSATAFQLKIWKYLCSIPEGETRYYSQIASDVGNPDGARAVARACATNPVALVIPCHRVVPKSGGLGGFRWGVNVKKHLLEQESR